MKTRLESLVWITTLLAGAAAIWWLVDTHSEPDKPVVTNKSCLNVLVDFLDYHDHGYKKGWTIKDKELGILIYTWFTDETLTSYLSIGTRPFGNKKFWDKSSTCIDNGKIYNVYNQLIMEK